MTPELTYTEQNTLIWALRLDGTPVGLLYRPNSEQHEAEMQTLSGYGYLTSNPDGSWVITPAGRARGIALVNGV